MRIHSSLLTQTFLFTTCLLTSNSSHHKGGSSLGLFLQGADGGVVLDQQEPLREDRRDRARQEAVHGEPGDDRAGPDQHGLQHQAAQEGSGGQEPPEDGRREQTGGELTL